MISPFLVWFLIGVGFLIAELQMPGFILIFFTAGCWVTAVAAWLTDITITWQIVLSIVSSLVLLVTLRKFGIKTFKGEKISSVDEAMADAKIGKTAVVTRDEKEQVDMIVEQCGLQHIEYKILFSGRCFKQRGAHYAQSRIKTEDVSIQHEMAANG